MSRAIQELLIQAATEAAENNGVVPLDVQTALAAEGYELSRLDRDVEAISVLL